MLLSRGSTQCGRCITELIIHNAEKFPFQSRNPLEVKATISACEMLMPGEKELIIAPVVPGHPRKASLGGVGGRSGHCNKCDGWRSS